jgi:hypothetical protein
MATAVEAFIHRGVTHIITLGHVRLEPFAIGVNAQSVVGRDHELLPIWREAQTVDMGQSNCRSSPWKEESGSSDRHDKDTQYEHNAQHAPPLFLRDLLAASFFKAECTIRHDNLILSFDI